MESLVFDLLLQKNKKIIFAESMTGGLLSYSLVKIKGSSKVLTGSIVAYQKEVKEKMLNVKNETIEKYGIVSKEVALEMALGGLKIGSDICVSITGDAGPTTQENKDKLGAFIAITDGKNHQTVYVSFNKKRIKNIRKAKKEVYSLIYDYLK